MALQAVACCFFVTASCALAAFGQDCPELVGRWPYGPAQAVAVAGDHVYFGSGTALVVADISNPASPVVLGDAILPDLPERIAVSGGYAYVVDEHSGLRVVDVSTPASPTEVGFLVIPGTSGPQDVAVSGPYAYVADGSGGLRVIDVSDP